jgi:hypothetical protein
VIFEAGHFDFGAAHIEFAGDYGKIFVGSGFDFFVEGAFAEERLVSAVAFGFFEAEAAGSVGLGIEVDEKNALAKSGEARGEIDGCGCFAHAAFLVGDSDHLSRHAGDFRAREKNINADAFSSFGPSWNLAILRFCAIEIARAAGTTFNAHDRE